MGWWAVGTIETHLWFFRRIDEKKTLGSLFPVGLTESLWLVAVECRCIAGVSSRSVAKMLRTSEHTDRADQAVKHSLREHRQLILNWFVTEKQYNTSIVGGLNAMVKLRFGKAFGFRTFEAIEVAFCHQLGQLPQREAAHRFR